jgi:hypothetical protein
LANKHETGEMAKMIIRSIRTHARTAGATVNVTGMYRKRGLQLPAEGETLIVENIANGKRFAGTVTKVDTVTRCYDFRVDLSQEITAEAAA